MDKNKKGRFTSTNKIMIGYVGLFVVFLSNIIFILLFIANDNTNTVDYRRNVSLLGSIEWSLLILGSFFTAVIFYWWMTRLKEQNAAQEMLAKLDAISKSQAIIEFDMDGIIISANEKFLEAVGYTLDEIKGRHHSILVDEEYKSSQEYRDFWDKLRRGEYDVAEYKRITKNRQAIWLQSSYNPIFDTNGKPQKIIKIATDITQRKNQEVELEKLTKNLHEVGLQIFSDSNDLSVGIEQLQTTAIDQAASASEQAAAITEISTAIEEIKTITQQTQEKAKQLGETAQRTSKEAENGKLSVEKMGEAMEVLKIK